MQGMSLLPKATEGTLGVILDSRAQRFCLPMKDFLSTLYHSASCDPIYSYRWFSGVECYRCDAYKAIRSIYMPAPKVTASKGVVIKQLTVQKDVQYYGNIYQHVKKMRWVDDLEQYCMSHLVITSTVFTVHTAQTLTSVVIKTVTARWVVADSIVRVTVVPEVPFMVRPLLPHPPPLITVACIFGHS